MYICVSKRDRIKENNRYRDKLNSKNEKLKESDIPEIQKINLGDSIIINYDVKTNDEFDLINDFNIIN